LPERPQDVVARGYDAGADAFADWQRRIKWSRRLERIDELLAVLPVQPEVLELGSGAGVRSTRVLIELEHASFDAVVSMYVFNHVPREELGPLLGRIAVWLRPGGYLLASFGASDLPGWYGTWLDGVETFFSGYEPEITLGLVRSAGFEVVRTDLETIREPEGEATFLWIFARTRA